MKDINKYINEGKSTLEDEMKEWEERLRQPFGQTLKELQWLINELGLYNSEKNEYGFYTFTPFDSFVTAYTLDGNKKFTFDHVKKICDDWDFSGNNKVKKVLDKLENLLK